MAFLWISFLCLFSILSSKSRRLDLLSLPHFFLLPIFVSIFQLVEQRKTTRSVIPTSRGLASYWGVDLALVLPTPVFAMGCLAVVAKDVLTCMATAPLRI